MYIIILTCNCNLSFDIYFEQWEWNCKKRAGLQKSLFIFIPNTNTQLILQKINLILIFTVQKLLWSSYILVLYLTVKHLILYSGVGGGACGLLWDFSFKYILFSEKKKWRLATTSMKQSSPRLNKRSIWEAAKKVFFLVAGPPPPWPLSEFINCPLLDKKKN